MQNMLLLQPLLGNLVYNNQIHYLIISVKKASIKFKILKIEVNSIDGHLLIYQYM